MTAVLIGLAVLVIGLGGAYSYWESYYEHRGFKTVALIHGAHRGRLVTVDFYSSALHREADYLAYLPPGYDPAKRYPVYYLLHGSPGRPQVFIAIADMGLRMDNLIAEHRMRPMILIYPDGRIGGSTYSDSEWANTPSGDFMSYVTDVVRDVDHRFSTIADRGARVIAGFSAGAYGATNIALHNLYVFGNLQSWSGYYIETRSGVFAHASTADLDYNSPLYYVRGLGPALAVDPLRAFLFIGRDDDSSPQTAPMARALAARGASVSYALYHGGHDWELWHAHLDQMLILAARDVSAPLRTGTGHARALTPGVVPIPNGAGRRRRQLLRTERRRERERRHEHLRRGREHRRKEPAASGGGASGGAPLIATITPHGLGVDSASAGLGLGELLVGLLLALVSAALINLGFLLQHRGLGQGVQRRGLAGTLGQAFRNPTWLSGQLLGWIGFVAQIVAVAVAPLSLVQAFAAGGLALSVPLAARLCSQRITRSQLLAVLLIAASLAILPIGFSTARDQLHTGPLAVCLVAATLAGLAISAVRTAGARAIAAGIFYGVADAAIKAVAVGWHAHGASAGVSIWTVVAALATFAGFLAFQSALRDGSAISAISLMTAFAALVALCCGQLAFSESLGTNAVAVVAHLAAIAVVLGCVPTLAAAQAVLAGIAPTAGGRERPHPPPLRPGYQSPG